MAEDSMEPEHPLLRVLRENARHLKKQSGASDAMLAERVEGVSKKTINNVTNARGNVTLDSFARFCEAVQAEPWMALMEDMPRDPEIRRRLYELVMTYCALHKGRGRENIERAAEIEAKDAGVFEALQSRFRRARRRLISVAAS